MKAPLIPRDRSQHLLRHPAAADPVDVASMAGEIERLHARLRLERERRTTLEAIARAATETSTRPNQTATSFMVNISGDADPKEIVAAIEKAVGLLRSPP